MNLYEIIFVDDSKFIGGTLAETKWMQIPDKKIKKLIYNLSNRKQIILEDYDAYYHFVEVTNDIMGEKKGQIQLEFTYLIGKKENEYKVHKINLKTNQVEIKILDEKDKMIQELNPIGWKKGGN
jgi:hypothetical protein